jgi:hypothetical protein
MWANSTRQTRRASINSWIRAPSTILTTNRSANVTPRLLVLWLHYPVKVTSHYRPLRRMLEQVNTSTKEREGSGRDQLNELSRHMPVRTNERYKNPRVRILCVAAKIRTRCLPHTTEEVTLLCTTEWTVYFYTVGIPLQIFLFKPG